MAYCLLAAQGATDLSCISLSGITSKPAGRMSALGQLLTSKRPVALSAKCQKQTSALLPSVSRAGLNGYLASAAPFSASIPRGQNPESPVPSTN
jgi:hypothetical protein